MSSKYSEPLLGRDADEESLDITPLECPTNGDRLLKASLVANFLLLAICVLLSIATVFLASPGDSQQITDNGHLLEPYSPANDFIDYEYRRMIFNDTRFTGHPGPVWENSIHELMIGTLIRISEDELKLLNADSIPLKDGGYAAGLGVAHNLHCVKQIKKFLYREHFYAELKQGGEEYDYLQTHADHCLDYLRQSVMCHLDFSIYTLYWDGMKNEKPTHRDPGTQKCVNWDKLHTWMLERQASTDMLVGP